MHIRTQRLHNARHLSDLQLLTVVVRMQARSMNSIPVERAQDLAKRGSGSVTLKRGQVTVYGEYPI